MNFELTNLNCGQILCEPAIRISTQCFCMGRYYFEFYSDLFDEFQAYALCYSDKHISYGEDVTFISFDGTAEPVNVIVANPG